VELENSFIVPADIDTAWRTLLDVESITPCMPGATLESFTGDTFVANVKVKLGPVTQTFKGEGVFLSKDEATHTAVIKASGKETKGGGTAAANITASLIAEGPNSTRAHIVTDLTITGKIAQFGKGVIVDVSKKLIDQFASNLQQVIAAQGATAAAAAQPAGAAPSAAPAAPAPAPVQAAESIDLLGAAGTPVLKRAIPVLIVVVVAVGIIWWIASR
jgi:carbon monoxide dehydrogenase subunit G